MWTIFILLYLISAALAWGLYIGRIRKMCPNGVFTPPGKLYELRSKSYDTAIVRAIAGPFSIWWTFKYEDGFKHGLKWK
jgi:hypothetical protein